MKKEGYRRKTTFEKINKSGLVWVRPNHGSTGFCRVVALAGLLTNPDWSSHQVNQVSGRPPGLVRV